MLTIDVVLKFGGSSVAEARHWKTIAALLKNKLNQGERPLLVLSALKNVSNKLEGLLHKAVNGKHQQEIDELKLFHLAFATQLDLALDSQLAPWFEQLNDDCLIINQSKEVTPQLHARVLAIGELLSTTIGFEYLKHHGLDVVWQDVREVLKSNDHTDQWHHYLSAHCDYEKNAHLSTRLINRVKNNRGVIITQGFIASDRNNDTVLLGREGSDTSAAYLAAILGANSLEIWTDVSGIFSANPRQISNTRRLSQLSYQQAQLMATFGAKVLHPRVIQPVLESEISVKVCNTGMPEQGGTLIKRDGLKEIPIKSIVYESNVTLISLELELSMIQVKSMIDQLLYFGFDIVLESEAENRHDLIMNYSNTDMKKLSDGELKAFFSGNVLSVISELSLISIIGETECEHWLSQSKQAIQELAHLGLLESYPSDKNDRLSILVKSSIHLELSQKLHDQLIG